MAGLSETTDLTGYCDKATYDGDADGKFANSMQEIGFNPVIDAKLFSKKASEDLRHSIDAAIENSEGSAWRKEKTLVFTEGVKGIIRVKVDVKGNDAVDCVKLTDKDGTLLGVAQKPDGCAAYATKSQDITVDFVADDEIQVWSSDNGCNTFIENFRVYYANDDTAVGVAVAVTGAD